MRRNEARSEVGQLWLRLHTHLDGLVSHVRSVRAVGNAHRAVHKKSERHALLTAASSSRTPSPRSIRINIVLFVLTTIIIIIIILAIAKIVLVVLGGHGGHDATRTDRSVGADVASARVHAYQASGERGRHAAQIE